MVRLRVMCQKRTQGRVARGCGRHTTGRRRAGEEERGEEREEPMATNTQVRYHMKLRQEGFSMHNHCAGGKGGKWGLLWEVRDSQLAALRCRPCFEGAMRNEQPS